MKQNRKPYLIGITGCIGSGKSEVSKYLISLGYPLVDADQISREVVEPGEIGLLKIVETFGDTILNADHSLNRRRLSQIIFKSDDYRLKLNGILHPEINRRIKQSIHQYFDEKFVFIDVPLLFETDSKSNYDEVLFVSAPEDVCLKRIVTRDSISSDMAMRKIKAQMSIDLKRSLSDHVIENNSDILTLHLKIDDYLRELNGRISHA